MASAVPQANETIAYNVLFPVPNGQFYLVLPSAESEERIPIYVTTKGRDLDALAKLPPKTRVALRECSGAWSSENVWDEFQRRGWQTRPHDAEMAALIVATDRARSKGL